MSYRIYGKAGQKVISGVMSDQIGGSQGLIPADHEQGTVSVSKRAHANIVTPEESGETREVMNTGIEVKKPTDNIYY